MHHANLASVVFLGGDTLCKQPQATLLWGLSRKSDIVDHSKAKRGHERKESKRNEKPEQQQQQARQTSGAAVFGS